MFIVQRHYLRVFLMVFCVLSLTGCMATLQTRQSPGQQASLPTVPTALSDVSSEVAQPTDLLAAPLPSQGDVAAAIGTESAPGEPSPTFTVGTESGSGEPSPTLMVGSESLSMELPATTPAGSEPQPNQLTPTVSPTSAWPSPVPQTPGEETTLQDIFVPEQGENMTVVTPPTLQPLTTQERWRREQLDRQPFEGVHIYNTSGSEVWWFDPLQQQHVILGTIAGDFQVQAMFTLRGQGIQALEVPYQVNQSYGLTSLSPALVQRIQAAGYGEWIEAYVFDSPNVQPR